MDKDQSIAAAIDAVRSKQHELKIFMDGISQWFSAHPKLSLIDFPIVHSVRARLKTLEHLDEKIRRKWQEGEPTDANNVFEKITDLAGARILHLYQDQFPAIHTEILEKVTELKDWYLLESPKAYTWDPESQQFFQALKIDVEIKESFYTSVHYLVRPRKDSPLCCEIQVRTLFEEIWGEVDHALNYPTPSEKISCREQLRVLAKLVGAGSRLVDSIFRSSR